MSPHPPQSVKIEVSGPRTLLSLIEPSGLTLKLDLSGAMVGQTSLRVNPEAFNVPRQTTVVGVTPSQIVLDIDQIATRDLPVHLRLTGAAATGYRVAATTVSPRTTTVRGPSRELARLDAIASEPLDLTGATSDRAQQVALVTPFGHTRIDPGEVTAKVVISPIMSEQEFRGIPLQVRGSDFPCRVEPAHVNLTLRGAQLALARLDPRDAAFIDAGGMAPGSYDATVRVALPDGIELVHQSAIKVKLRIYRARRTARP